MADKGIAANPLAALDIENTFTVETPNGEGGVKRRVHGVRYNAWGLAKVEEFAGSGSAEILMAVLASGSGKGRGGLGYRQTLAILAGGLEGYRFQHKNSAAPVTLEDAARIMDEIQVPGKTGLQAIVALTVPHYIAAMPRTGDIPARAGVPAAAQESEGGDPLPDLQTGKGT